MRGTACLGAIVVAALVALAGPAAAQSGRTQSAAAQQAEILASVGGAYEGPQAAYVRRVGERMATAAGMPGRCVFTIVNSEVVNAFTAPPGCYVYVTRGLLAIMNSEAELAAVLGHELGHVAAKHAMRQKNTEALTGIAAALAGALTKSEMVGQLASQAGQLGALGFSRSQEYEADTLALRYLPSANYSVDGMSRVLADLQREEALTRGASGGKPQKLAAWGSTHPLTTDRIQRVDAAAAKLPPQEGLVANEAAFLTALDGLPYGEDPSKGYARGSSFIHPGLRITFDAPSGARLVNSNEAVGITGPGDLRGKFAAGGSLSGGLDAYAADVMRQLVGQAQAQIGSPRRTTVNGLDAAIVQARGTSQGAAVDATVVAYALDGRAYQFVTLAPAGQTAPYEPMFRSFRRLSDREVATAGGQRIAIVTVRPGDTAETLGGRMAATGDGVARFRMLNGLGPGQPLEPGRRVKLVTDLSPRPRS